MQASGPREAQKPAEAQLSTTVPVSLSDDKEPAIVLTPLSHATATASAASVVQSAASKSKSKRHQKKQNQSSPVVSLNTTAQAPGLPPVTASRSVPIVDSRIGLPSYPVVATSAQLAERPIAIHSRRVAMGDLLMKPLTLTLMSTIAENIAKVAKFLPSVKVESGEFERAHPFCDSLRRYALKHLPENFQLLPDHVLSQPCVVDPMDPLIQSELRDNPRACACDISQCPHLKNKVLLCVDSLAKVGLARLYAAMAAGQYCYFVEYCFPEGFQGDVFDEYHVSVNDGMATWVPLAADDGQRPPTKNLGLIKDGEVLWSDSAGSLIARVGWCCGPFTTGFVRRVAMPLPVASSPVVSFSTQGQTANSLPIVQAGVASTQRMTTIRYTPSWSFTEVAVVLPADFAAELVKTAYDKAWDPSTRQVDETMVAVILNTIESKNRSFGSENFEAIRPAMIAYAVSRIVKDHEETSVLVKAMTKKSWLQRLRLFVSDVLDWMSNHQLSLALSVAIICGWLFKRWHVAGTAFDLGSIIAVVAEEVLKRSSSVVAFLLVCFEALKHSLSGSLLQYIPTALMHLGCVRLGLVPAVLFHFLWNVSAKALGHPTGSAGLWPWLLLAGIEVSVTLNPSQLLRTVVASSREIWRWMRDFGGSMYQTICGVKLHLSSKLARALSYFQAPSPVAITTSSKPSPPVFPVGVWRLVNWIRSPCWLLRRGGSPIS